MRLTIPLTFILAVFATQAAAVEVWIDRPSGLEYVYGQVEILATVVSEESVAGVEIWVDGNRLGELVEPPYNVTVDVGYDNKVHEFKAIARSSTGNTATQFDRRVLDLQRQDFRILDDGDRQEMVTFERGDVPLAAVLLLDCSLSMMGERLEAALNGARVFVEGMEELDEAMVMLFSDRLLRENRPSSTRRLRVSRPPAAPPSTTTSLRRCPSSRRGRGEESWCCFPMARMCTACSTWRRSCARRG
jgi:hypothetical protein